MATSEKQPEVSSGLAVASLAVGIVAFLLSWTGVFGLPVAVVATVFGVIALVGKQNKNMAVAGLVLGIVSLVVSGIFTVLSVAFIMSGADPLPAVHKSHHDMRMLDVEDF